MCCKDNNNLEGMVIVYPSDVGGLCNFLSCTKTAFFDRFCDNDFVRFNGKKIPFYKLKKNDGNCIFLSQNLCSIYPVRPIQCRRAPFNYLASDDMWGHLNCVEKNDFKDCYSTQDDIKLVTELLMGYE